MSRHASIVLELMSSPCYLTRNQLLHAHRTTKKETGGGQHEVLINKNKELLQIDDADTDFDVDTILLVVLSKNRIWHDKLEAVLRVRQSIGKIHAFHVDLRL